MPWPHVTVVAELYDQSRLGLTQQVIALRLSSQTTVAAAVSENEAKEEGKLPLAERSNNHMWNRVRTSLHSSQSSLPKS